MDTQVTCDDGGVENVSHNCITVPITMEDLARGKQSMELTNLLVRKLVAN